MEMCYDGALVMPSSYAVMEEEEMVYVEGGAGITIPTLVTYMSRTVCEEKAKELKAGGYCINMSVTDIAKEIHAHAVYGYGFLGAANAPIALRDVCKAISDKGLNGITLEDNCDSWYRVAAYNLAWPIGLE